MLSSFLLWKVAFVVMPYNSKNMLTNPLHSHPWTRVSWISGSDIDDLDEEEVQEVESITLGRAFSNGNEANAAAAATVGSPNDADEDDVQTQRISNPTSVTLKPFSFESSQQDSSVLAPFASNFSFPRNNNSETSTSINAANTNSSSNTSGSKDIHLASPKGYLITPAVTDAVSEGGDDVEPKRPTWKSFWQGEANKEEVTREDATIITTMDRVTLNDHESDEEEDDGVTEKLNLATVPKLLYQVATDLGVSAQQKAKAGYQWVVDGMVLLSIQLAAVGIFVQTWIHSGLTTATTVLQDAAVRVMDFWETAGAALPVVAGFAVAMAACLLVLPVKRTPSPTNDLREFVRFEKANNAVDLKVIDELNTEAFSTYARSTCVEAATFEQARTGLDLGLFGVPNAVRNTVVQMAIIEGVTQKNSVQDSNSDFVNSGKADAFMAFWSTAYDPTDEHRMYKSCVMVTGVALTVAETVAEWTSKREMYQIGTEPCQCGTLVTLIRFALCTLNRD